MFNLRRSLVILSFALFSVSSFAGGKTTVKDVPTYQQAVIEACDGSAVGASCTIMFQGGSVSIGVCVQVPGSPAGANLTCQIDPANLPSCKNNATGTPGAAMIFAVLALGLFAWRRRQVA
ncbi:MAG: hypothetical protein WCK49_00915 [Myxococcaceae bacterium]